MTEVIIIIGTKILLLVGCLTLVVAALIALYKRRWKKFGIYFVVAFVLFLLSGLILGPHISRVSDRTVCRSNLSQIGRACYMYSRYHNKDFPPSFLSLTNYYVEDPKLFICPGSGKQPGPMETVDEWTDYILVTNLSAISDSDFVLVYCKPENHKKRDPYFIILADFSVVKVKSKDFGKVPCDLIGHSRMNKRPQSARGE